MGITSRIDNVTNIPAEFRARLLPPPPSVKIEITSRCPYRCKFCVKSITEAPPKEMDRSLYSQVIRDMYESGVRELAPFFVGESFTCKWLPDAILEAKQVGFPYVFLTTNGASALPKIVEKCMAAGLDSLKFSLNFHSAEQLADVAQVDGSNWRRAIDNLKAARRIRDEGEYGCQIYASYIQFNDEQAEKMQKVVDEITPICDEVYRLPLYGMQGAAEKWGGKPKAGNPGRYDNQRPSLPCWSVFREAHIDVEGRLVACCFGGENNQGMVMADLKEVDFMTGWNSKAFQSLRQAHLNEDVAGTPCESCAAGS